MDRSGYKAELIAVARPFWDAEAEVAHRFFAKKPSREDWIRYLRAAVYKELNPAIGYGPTTGFACGLHMEFAKIVDMFKGLDASVDRRELYHHLHVMTEEFNHYLVLAEVLEFVLGRKLTRDDPEQLPEDKKLNAMRRAHVESGDPCLRAVMGLTEGGGSSTFREMAKLSGGPLEDRLAQAMQVIYVDEKDHYGEAATAAATAVGSPADLARMKKALHEVSVQRVRMRSEMLGWPMSEAEIDRLAACHPVR
ncbi:MAG: hypothetical protein FJX67_12415 [Alphaproteobacteria bacterium]|nr:hypothetical protein [Alphaproteobacteria bacterium]